MQQVRQLSVVCRRSAGRDSSFSPASTDMQPGTPDMSAQPPQQPPPSTTATAAGQRRPASVGFGRRAAQAG